MKDTNPTNKQMKEEVIEYLSDCCNVSVCVEGGDYICTSCRGITNTHRPTQNDMRDNYSDKVCPDCIVNHCKHCECSNCGESAINKNEMREEIK